MINYHVNDLVMAVKNDPIIIENWFEDQRKTDYIMLHLDDFKKFKAQKFQQRSTSLDSITKLPKVRTYNGHINQRYQEDQRKFWKKIKQAENFNTQIISSTLDNLKNPERIETKIMRRYRQWNQRASSSFLKKENIKKEDLPLRNLKIGHIIQTRSQKINENSSIKQEQLLYLENRMKNLRKTLNGEAKEQNIGQEAIDQNEQFKKKYDFQKSFLNMPKYLDDNYKYPLKHNFLVFLISTIIFQAMFFSVTQILEKKQQQWQKIDKQILNDFHKRNKFMFKDKRLYFTPNLFKWGKIQELTTSRNCQKVWTFFFYLRKIQKKKKI